MASQCVSKNIYYDFFVIIFPIFCIIRFNLLLNISPLFFVVTILLMNVIGLIGFTKNLFNTLFGAPVIKEYIVYDLTKREIFIFGFLILNLVALNIITLVVF